MSKFYIGAEVGEKNDHARRGVIVDSHPERGWLVFWCGTSTTEWCRAGDLWLREEDGAGRPPPDGAEMIAAERWRHTAVEGWTPEHDDEHSSDEMAMAAAAYALPDDLRECRRYDDTRIVMLVPRYWPWDARSWKPTPGDRIRELVKAGALCAAEIDRLQRRAP